MEYLRVTVAIGLRDHTWIERTVEIDGNSIDDYAVGEMKAFPESNRNYVLGLAIGRIQCNNGLDGLNISHFALLDWEIFEK